MFSARACKSWVPCRLLDNCVHAGTSLCASRCVCIVCSTSSEQATVNYRTLRSSNNSPKSDVLRSIYKANLPWETANAVVTSLGHQWWQFLDSKRRRYRHHHRYGRIGSGIGITTFACITGREARAQWYVVLSSSPASSHCSRADVFGKTPRVIAALL